MLQCMGFIKPPCILTSHEQCSVAEALLQCNPCNLNLVKSSNVLLNKWPRWLRSVFRKQTFQFVAWQICIAHDWLSKNKLFLLCKSSKSHVLQSERLIYLFHLWNWTSCKLEQCKQIQTKKIKNIWRSNVLQNRRSKLYCLQNYVLPQITR